jgi:hypothetical protein
MAKTLSDYLEGADIKDWLKTASKNNRNGLAKLLKHLGREDFTEYFNPGTESGSTPGKRVSVFIEALLQVTFGPHYDRKLSSQFLDTTASIINENINVQPQWHGLKKLRNAVFKVLVGVAKDRTIEGDDNVDDDIMVSTADPLLKCLTAIHNFDPPKVLEELLKVDEVLDATIRWSTLTTFSCKFEAHLVQALKECLKTKEIKPSTSAGTSTAESSSVYPLHWNKKHQKALIQVIKRLKKAAPAAAKLLATWYALDNNGQDPVDSKSLSADLKKNNLIELLIERLPKEASELEPDMDGVQSALSLLVLMLAGDVTLFDDYRGLPSLLLLGKRGGVVDTWTSILASTLVVHLIESPTMGGKLDEKCIDDIVNLCHYLLTSAETPRQIYIGVRLSRFVEKLDARDRERICQHFRRTVEADLLECLHRFEQSGRVLASHIGADATESRLKIPDEFVRIGWSAAGDGQSWDVLDSGGGFKGNDFQAQVFTTLSTYISLPPWHDDKGALFVIAGRNNDSRTLMHVENFLEGHVKMLRPDSTDESESINHSALDAALSYWLKRINCVQMERRDDQPFLKRTCENGWVTSLKEWVLQTIKQMSPSHDSTDPENQVLDLARFISKFADRPHLFTAMRVTTAQAIYKKTEYVNKGFFQRILRDLQPQMTLLTQKNMSRIVKLVMDPQEAEFKYYDHLLEWWSLFFALQCNFLSTIVALLPCMKVEKMTDKVLKAMMELSFMAFTHGIDAIETYVLDPAVAVNYMSVPRTVDHIERELELYKYKFTFYDVSRKVCVLRALRSIRKFKEIGLKANDVHTMKVSMRKLILNPHHGGEPFLKKLETEVPKLLKIVNLMGLGQPQMFLGDNSKDPYLHHVKKWAYRRCMNVFYEVSPSILCILLVRSY